MIMAPPAEGCAENHCHEQGQLAALLLGEGHAELRDCFLSCMCAASAGGLKDVLRGVRLVRKADRSSVDQP